MNAISIGAQDFNIYISEFFGQVASQMDSLCYVLIACVCLDYISGILNAIAKRKLSSKVGAKGICRKILIFMIVGVGHLFDTIVIGEGSTLRTSLTLFYICNESISILENADGIGLPIPDVLRRTIESIEKQNGNVSSSDNSTGQTKSKTNFR